MFYVRTSVPINVNRVTCPSPLLNITQNKRIFEVRIVIAIGRIVSPDERIIDDNCLVLFLAWHSFQLIHEADHMHGLESSLF